MNLFHVKVYYRRIRATFFPPPKGRRNGRKVSFVDHMTDKMAGARLGDLDIKTTVLFVCDIQEKFSPHIQYFDVIIEGAKRLVCMKLPSSYFSAMPVSSLRSLPFISYYFLQGRKFFVQWDVCITP